MAKVALVALAYDPQFDPFSAVDAYKIAAAPTRAIAVTAAIKEAARHKAAWVFFSGYTAAITRLSQVVSSPIANCLRANNLSGIFELVEPGIANSGGKGHGAVPDRADLLTRRAFYVMTPHQKVPAGPFYQRIVQSCDATAARLRTLAEELAKGGVRRHQVAGHDLALLICGESNILHTRRSTRKTGTRYQRHHDWFDYHLIFNPQHSVWKRFELDERLKFLSRRGSNQLAASCTNYPSNRPHLQRIICIAQGGRLLTLTELSQGDNYVLHMLDF